MPAPFGESNRRAPQEEAKLSSSQSARLAIVIYSLAITGSLIVFLLLAQPLGIRFDFGQEQNLRLIDIIIPTFLGYVGAASNFLFNAGKGREVDEGNAQLLKILVHGPFLIFIAAVAALFYSYHVSHRPLAANEARVDVLDFNALSRYLSVCLGLLAASVTVISNYLFGTDARAVATTKPTGKE
jgi:hypothetical protein